MNIVADVKTLCQAIKPGDDYMFGADLTALYTTAQTHSASIQSLVNADGMPAGLDAFIMSALEGTGSFSAAGEEAGRKEAVVKSTMNNLLSAMSALLFRSMMRNPMDTCIAGGL